jgi:hypothetical protein
MEPGLFGRLRHVTMDLGVHPEIVERPGDDGHHDAARVCAVRVRAREVVPLRGSDESDQQPHHRGRGENTRQDWAPHCFSLFAFADSLGIARLPSPPACRASTLYPVSEWLTRPTAHRPPAHTASFGFSNLTRDPVRRGHLRDPGPAHLPAGLYLDLARQRRRRADRDYRVDVVDQQLPGNTRGGHGTLFAGAGRPTPRRRAPRRRAAPADAPPSGPPPACDGQPTRRCSRRHAAPSPQASRRSAPSFQRRYATTIASCAMSAACAGREGRGQAR